MVLVNSNTVLVCAVILAAVQYSYCDTPPQAKAATDETKVVSDGNSKPSPEKKPIEKSRRRFIPLDEFNDIAPVDVKDVKEEMKSDKPTQDHVAVKEVDEKNFVNEKKDVTEIVQISHENQVILDNENEAIYSEEIDSTKSNEVEVPVKKKEKTHRKRGRDVKYEEIGDLNDSDTPMMKTRDNLGRDVEQEESEPSNDMPNSTNKSHRHQKSKHDKSLDSSSQALLEGKGDLMIEDLGILGNNEMISKILTHESFQPIPSDLTGTSDREITEYVNLLLKERRNIQHRFIFHLAQTLIVGVGSYFFQENLLLPILKRAVDHDEDFSVIIEAQWAKHQERLADFLLEYMRIKKINPSELHTTSLGVPYIKVRVAPKSYVKLPVWRTRRGAPLPPDAKNISQSSKRMLKNWWNDE